MGIENNEIVIATTWDNKIIEEIKEWISKEIPSAFQKLFVFIPSIVNTKTTIIFGPTGSKKGWETDIKGEELRNKFIKKLGSYDYIFDGINEGSPFDFVEVGYGECGQKILRGNCKNQIDNKEYHYE
ncbi:MAG: hypothetical protein SVO01_00745 [Thermotogota bacterium]|nr:hypothetical protein [Thermotogota bacterium]